MELPKDKEESAIAAYTKADRKLKALISQLDTRVEEHKRRFAKDSKNWGFVGDMNRWVEALDSIVNPK